MGRAGERGQHGSHNLLVCVCLIGRGPGGQPKYLDYELTKEGRTRSHVTTVRAVLQVDLAKTRPQPKPAHENPPHGAGWVLVSKPVGGSSFRKPDPRPKWVPI